MITENGCVYFIKHKGLDGVKIGFSNNETPSKRVRDMETYTPTGVDFLGLIITNNPAKVEKELHKKYADKRMVGEFFDISLDEIDFEVKQRNCESEHARRDGINRHYARHVEFMHKSKLEEGDTVSMYDRIYDCMKRLGYSPISINNEPLKFVSDAEFRLLIEANLKTNIDKETFDIAMASSGYEIFNRGVVEGYLVYKLEETK